MLKIYAHVYQGVRNVSLLANFAFTLNEWSLEKTPEVPKAAVLIKKASLKTKGNSQVLWNHICDEGHF